MTDLQTAAVTPGDLLDMMRRRRSSRTGFLENTEIPDETVMLLLEAARAAPSGGNAQPWEFIIIRDKAMRMRIADLYKHQLTEKIELERTIRGTSSVSGVGWRNAPVLILVLGDPRTSLCFPLRTAEDKADSHFYSGLANATLQLMLMAESLGLSTQYVSDVASPYFSLMLKHMLDIPKELRVYHIVPVGYTEVIATPKSRRPIDSMVHFECYDAAKLRSVEYLEMFAAEDSIQAKDYDRGGTRIGN